MRSKEKKVPGNGTLDDAIRSAYKRFQTPVDQIVATPDLAEEFTGMVKEDLPNGDDVDVATVNWRLLTLRKRGEDKGGLGRLERSYNGRKNKPR